jgi:hypothetical protein
MLGRCRSSTAQPAAIARVPSSRRCKFDRLLAAVLNTCCRELLTCAAVSSATSAAVAVAVAVGVGVAAAVLAAAAGTAVATLVLELLLTCALLVCCRLLRLFC